MISIDELKNALKRIGKKSSAKTINKIIQDCHFTEGEKIKYTDFLAATTNIQDLMTDEHITFLFDYYDTENKGYISRSNLEEAFTNTGRKYTQQEIDEILKAEGKSADGMLDKNEFKLMMLRIIDSE